MIKGIKVILYEKIESGKDEFNAPVYTETPVEVANVLVAPSQEQEVLDTLQLYGKKAIYTLGIPKGDTHEWSDRTVEFFGQKWHTIGKPIKGIEKMVPGKWNQKVRCESYE